MVDEFPTKGMLTLLRRWKGADARIWSYSISHRSLVVRLEQPNREGYLSLYIGDTSYVQCPTQWARSDFFLATIGTDDFGEPVLAALDSGARVVLAGGVIEIKEMSGSE